MTNTKRKGFQAKSIVGAGLSAFLPISLQTHTPFTPSPPLTSPPLPFLLFRPPPPANLTWVMFPQQVSATEWITMQGQILGEQDLQHGVQCYHHMKEAAAGRDLIHLINALLHCLRIEQKDFKKKERKKPKCLSIFKISRASNHTPSKIKCLDLCCCFFFLNRLKRYNF